MRIVLTNCRKNLQYFYQIPVDAFKFRICQIFRFMEQSQPVLRFVRFLQSDLHLGNEVGCALSPLGFRNVRTDTGAAFAYLLGDHIFMFTLGQILVEVYDTH